MTNCIRCGRPIDDTTQGTANLCPECRAAFAGTAQPPPIPASAPPGAPVRTPAYRPPVTVAILALNILVFAAMVFTGASAAKPSDTQLLQWGADYGPFTLGGQFWRTLTSTFMHIRLAHLAVNMWSLWQIGRLTERIFGKWAYAMVYTATGIAASLASLFWNPMRITAGASGALFGIVGALIAALWLGKLPFPKPVVQRTLKNLVVVVAVNLLFGARAGFVDNSAHIGGLLAGLAIGALLAPQLAQAPEQRRAHERMIFLAVALSLIGFGAYVKHHSGWVVEKYRQLLSSPQSEDTNP
jgi:membrane associated rhomboid family serine protease